MTDSLSVIQVFVYAICNSTDSMVCNQIYILEQMLSEKNNDLHCNS